MEIECRRPPEEDKDTTPIRSAAVKDQANEPEAESFIICRQCRQIITRPAERIFVNGSHRHTFANPLGIVFEIGCFRSAMGCAPAGSASDEFTWFAGYSWRLVLCAGCLTHLGWSFTAPGGDQFFGLILDHLATSE